MASLGSVDLRLVPYDTTSEASSPEHLAGARDVGELRRVVIVVSGFRQHVGAANGSIELWAKLRGEHHNGVVLVDLRDWRERWDRYAEFLWRQRPKDGALPSIVICAYSWGAGYGFLKLAGELGKRGLSIDRAVLCDPVYRHGYWLGQWRALLPNQRIVVPANVRRVDWCYQRRSLPAGHAVVAADPRLTEVTDGIPLPWVTHSYADESPVYHALALEAAESCRDA